MTAQKHAPWTAAPHPWPEQIGCCPLVGRPYSVHGTDSRNVAAATTPEIARLIAASPDMLEAFERILASDGMRPGHVEYLSRAEIAAIARDAKAKATGQ